MLEEEYTTIIFAESEGESEILDILMGEKKDCLNIGGVATAKIGDIAWIDENQNSLQDDDEKRLQGIEVYLFQNGKEIDRTVTDENGYYLFENVYPTLSQVQVKMPKELLPTAINAEYPLISSILVGYNNHIAYSEEMLLASGEKQFGWDLGFILETAGILPVEAIEKPIQNWGWEN